MRYILAILLLVGLTAAGQNKTVINPPTGNKNTLTHFADGLFTDSILLMRPVCGFPTIDMTNYMAAKKWSSIVNDTCANVWYGWSPAANAWSPISGVRDTARLNAGWGILAVNVANPEDSFYQPNGPPIVFMWDSSAATPYIVQIINNDTSIINNNDSISPQFTVDTLTGTPPGYATDGFKVLVAKTGLTGAFVGHGNEIAELVGATWTFTEPENNDQTLVDNERGGLYQYNESADIWKLTSIFWRAFGNKGTGRNAWIGKGDKQPVYFRSWNKIFMYGDTTRKVYLPLYAGLEDSNVLLKVGVGGLIDTAYARNFVAGTGIEIVPGTNRTDTIKATGSGGSETWEQTLQNQGSTPFTTDNTVDLGGKYLTLNSGISYSALTDGTISMGNIDGANYTQLTLDNSNKRFELQKSDGDNSLTSRIATNEDSIFVESIDNATTSRLTIKPDTVTISTVGTSEEQLPVNFKVNLPSGTFDNTKALYLDGTQLKYGTVSGGGSGTVTSFSAGDLTPLFTSNVATATTTPALTFTLSNAAANTVLGNATGGSTTPSYGQIVNGQITNATIVATTKLSATGTPSSSTYLRGDNTWATVSAGSTFTRQVITSGSSGTVTGGNYIVTIDPASTLAAYALTLPASPSDLDVVEIDFGGTLTSGGIVTSLSILPNSGQTILDNTAPTSATADNTILYRYRASNTTWYRFKP